MDISSAKQVDDNGNISYRVTRDGVHLGDIVKLANGQHRPESVNGTHGPDSTIKAAKEWLAIYAKPTPDAVSAVIQNVTWHLEVKIPADIKATQTGTRNARRLAGLRTTQAELNATLSRLVTELGAAIAEQNR